VRRFYKKTFPEMNIARWGTFNNGVQYYPGNSKLSQQVAQNTAKYYDEITKGIGYLFTTDQTAYSLAMHGAGLHQSAFSGEELNGQVPAVLHAYNAKRLYQFHLENSGIWIDEKPWRFKNVYSLIPRKHFIDIAKENDKRYGTGFRFPAM
jgi:hypothetical protein